MAEGDLPHQGRDEGALSRTCGDGLGISQPPEKPCTAAALRSAVALV